MADTDLLNWSGMQTLWEKIKSYVTTAIAGKANDADVVHKTGDENINGVKKFYNGINIGVRSQISGYRDAVQDQLRLYTSAVSDSDSSLSKDNYGLIAYLKSVKSNGAHVEGQGYFQIREVTASGTVTKTSIDIDESNKTSSIANDSIIIPTGKAIYNWATPLLDAKADAKAWGSWIPESRLSGKFVVGDSSRSDFGGPFTASNWGCTGYLDVTPGEKIAFPNYNVTAETTITGYCFYDSNKKAISGGTCIPGQPAISQVCTVLVVPGNAYYFRFSYRIDEANNIWTYGMPYFIRNVGGVNVLSQLVRTVMPRFETIENMVRANFAPKDIVVTGDYTAEIGNTYIYAASGMATVAPASECNVGDWFKCIVANGGGQVQDTNSTTIGRMSYNGTYLYIVIVRNDSKVWAQYSI